MKKLLLLFMLLATPANATLWTPANLTDGSMELWFDANNAGSLSLSGSNVLSWTDLTNGVVVTPASGNPTYTASLLNGLPGITVGTPLFRNTSTAHAPFTGNMSCFMVYNVTTGAGGHIATFGAYVASGGGEPNFGFDNLRPAHIYINQSGVSSSASTQTLAQSTPAIVEWVGPGVSGGSWGPVTPYINGNVGGTISALAGFSYTQAGIEIGSNSGGDNGGNVHEIVILNTQASTTSRQLIEGYLAWKWGLQASLPGGHPYASAAPTIPVSTIGIPHNPTYDGLQ